MTTIERATGWTAAELDEARRYSLVIQWSSEDRAYIVIVPELPGCITHGATWEEATRQAEDAIATWLAAARAWDEPIPAPRLLDVSGALPVR
jgi:predicted RNase H-like HicB family nuclease